MPRSQWGARRGASGRQYRAMTGDVQRLKLLVEPLLATSSHALELHGIQMPVEEADSGRSVRPSLALRPKLSGTPAIAICGGSMERVHAVPGLRARGSPDDLDDRPDRVDKHTRLRRVTRNRGRSPPNKPPSKSSVWHAQPGGIPQPEHRGFAVPGVHDLFRGKNSDSMTVATITYTDGRALLFGLAEGPRWARSWLEHRQTQW